jgi:hypothetical protein
MHSFVSAKSPARTLSGLGKGEHPTIAQHRHQLSEEQRVVLDPVEARVGENEIKGLIGLPGSDVGQHEVETVGHGGNQVLEGEGPFIGEGEVLVGVPGT